MNKWKRYIRLEADVEFFACVHGASMISVYGFLSWLAGDPSVSFFIIFEMMMLGYANAWIQKGLFMKETAYSIKRYHIREVLWCLIPCILQLITGSACGWFSQKPWGTEAAYYIIMICYFVMVRLFVKFIYREDTEEMNRLLKKRRQDKENKEGNGT